MDDRSLSQAKPAVNIAGLSALETNKVLRNTYLLLGITIAFSALVAYAAMALGAPRPPMWLCLVGVLGLSYLVHKTADSGMGLVMSFLFTGFLGYILGPILSLYLQLPNGGEIVGSALTTTAVAFIGLSSVVLISKKDLSFMTSFVHVGWMVLLATVVLSLVFDFSAFYTVISAGVVLLMSATILWQTSSILNGGETNYIRATAMLYMSVYNMFTALLHLFMAFDD